MKILHVNTYDQGGAAKACTRLHLGLLLSAAKSKLLLRVKRVNTPESLQYQPSVGSNPLLQKVHNLKKVLVRTFPISNRRENWIKEFKSNLPKGAETFSFPTSSFDITETELYKEADIINLHWVSDFLNYESFFSKNRKPVVWTLHDIEPFSGGQHYFEHFLGMDGYGYPIPNRLSAIVKSTIESNLQVKLRSLENFTDLTVVAPSKWLTNESKNSVLFKNYPHYTIPYGVDTSIFKPLNKKFARELLGLPPEKICILFVADSINKYRKGYAYLKKAFEGLSYRENVHLIAIGGHSTEHNNTSQITYLGKVNDERVMAAVYAASDLFVISSIEDNLPNTVLESLLCGTPVVGFPVGGICDVVIDGINGLLCSEISAPNLQKTIEKSLEMLPQFNTQLIALDAATKFNLKRQAQTYLDLYSQILSKTDIDKKY